MSKCLVLGILWALFWPFGTSRAESHLDLLQPTFAEQVRASRKSRSRWLVSQEIIDERKKEYATALLERWLMLTGVKPGHLKPIPGSEDLKAFLVSDPPLQIRASESGDGIGSSEMGTFSSRTINLNYDFLWKALTEVESDLADFGQHREERKMDILAIKYFSVFAHEIQHGLIEEAFCKAFGKDLPQFLEGEMIAHQRELRAYHQAQETYPNEMKVPVTFLDKKTKFLQESNEDPKEALRGFTKKYYSNPSILLEVTAAKHEMQSNIDNYVPKIERYDAIERALSNNEYRFESERERAKTILESERQFISDARVRVRENKAGLLVISEPDQLRKWQDLIVALLKKVDPRSTGMASPEKREQK